MGFSGNFTHVALRADPERAGEKALFVKGRTDDTAEPPLAIHVVMPHDDTPLTATVLKPTLIDWEVKFPAGTPPIKDGDDVFVVGVAIRPAPHDPFVWEGSFTVATEEEP